MPKHVLMMDPAGALTTDDILYLIQGTGLDCDRKVSLAALRAFVMGAANIVNTNNIVNNAITNAKMADASVGTAELMDEAVTTTKIKQGAVTQYSMGTNSVGADQIIAGAVGTAELMDNSVTKAKMADASVGTAELIDEAVTTTKIKQGAVTQYSMGTNSVGADQIIDGSVTSAKLSGTLIAILTGLRTDVDQMEASQSLLNDIPSSSVGATATGNNIAVGYTELPLVAYRAYVLITNSTGPFQQVTIGPASGLIPGEAIWIKVQNGRASESSNVYFKFDSGLDGGNSVMVHKLLNPPDLSQTIHTKLYKFVATEHGWIMT